MEDEQIISRQDNSFEENKPSPDSINKALLGIIFMLLLIIVGGGAYFLGNNSSGTNTPTPTPKSTLKTLGEQAPTPTEEPTQTSTESGLIEETLIPTLSISAKPSITMENQDLKLKPTNIPTPTIMPLNAP